MQKQLEKTKNFTDMKVWQEGHKLVLIIYKISEKFPKSELYGLSSQLRRAAVSITCNLAEGFSRWSFKEKSQFYSISHGSLTEVENCLILAKDLNYIDSKIFEDTRVQLLSVHKLLNLLIKSTRSY